MADTSIARANDGGRPCPLCAALPDPKRPPIRLDEGGLVTVYLVCSEGHGWPRSGAETS